MISTIEEKKLRGLTFQFWLDNNCCDLKDVARAFGLTYPIIAKWRRQDNWDLKSSEIIQESAYERQKTISGSDAEANANHLKLIRFMVAKYTKMMQDLESNTSSDEEYEIKLNFIKNNLITLINMETNVRTGKGKVKIKDVEKMYFIPPEDVIGELESGDSNESTMGVT